MYCVRVCEYKTEDKNNEELRDDDHNANALSLFMTAPQPRSFAVQQ